MMAITDIFDALVAKDRPYKKAIPYDRALSILEYDVKAGKLDAELFKIFVEAKIRMFRTPSLVCARIHGTTFVATCFNE